MTMPPGAILKKRRDLPLGPHPQPTTARGKLIGRPRDDARLLAILKHDELMTAAEIAARLGISLGTTYQLLYRAQQRGLIERQFGYRPTSEPQP